jgi:hypothetical protein
MPFCVAGVTLRDIFRMGQKSVCVTGAILWRRFQAQHFGDLHILLVWQAQRFRHVVSRVLANRSVRAASSGDNAQIVWQA